MDQTEMQSQVPAQGGAPAAGGQQMQAPNPETMSPIVQGHMDELAQMRKLLDGKLGDAYDRVTAAGMKMMYAPDNAEMIHGLIMDEQVPVANKLGEGVANLLVMMDNQGNGSIPKEILVPVGVTLLFEAADYLFEVGVEYTEDDLAKALELMIDGVFVGYGIDPKQIDKVVDDMGKKLGFEGAGDDAEEAAETPAEETAEGPQGEAAEDAAFQQGFDQEQTARGQA